MFATDAVRVKSWVTQIVDSECGILSTEIDFLQDVFDIEDRFTIFKQVDPSDANITYRAFAFKYNNCKLRAGLSVRENLLMQSVKEGAKELDVKCPLRKGLKMYAYNQSFCDSFLPPIPNEARFRLHKEVFVKLSDSKKWTKYFTEDIFLRIKK